MLHYFLVLSVCLTLGCGDQEPSLTGGTGGDPATGGTAGDPLLPVEVEDFSDFTSFRYATQDFGFCNPSEYVANAVITKRADGEWEFSYTALLFGDSTLDDCVDLYAPPVCLVEESPGPRELTADERSSVHTVFSAVSFMGKDPNCPFVECDPCINSVIEWDETRHVDDFCSCPSFSISYRSLAAIKNLLEQLRLREL